MYLFYDLSVIFERFCFNFKLIKFTNQNGGNSFNPTLNGQANGLNRRSRQATFKIEGMSNEQPRQEKRCLFAFPRVKV